MEIFSKRLKQLRQESGKLQTVVSADLNFSQGIMSAYENGREPSYDVLVQLAQYFDVSTDYLLGLSVDRKPAGDGVTSILEQLAPLTTASGADPVAASDLVAMFGRLLTYYKHGAPAGNTPLETLNKFIPTMGDVLTATVSGSTADTLDAVNALAATILDANNIMTAFLHRKPDIETLLFAARGGDVSRGEKRIVIDLDMERELQDRKGDTID